jgi:hypothetical protein
VFTDHFKSQYGTDCISALHHNKRKTNYHIHLILSERTLLEQPIEKVATRNMFYDEKGTHVRTKKEILDEEGNIRKGCNIIKKGEVYERKLFSVKDTRFKSEGFLDMVKQDYTNLINQYVKGEKQKLQVFERGGMYLATKKLGKNNPKADEIESDNQQRTKWNEAVDRALVTGVEKETILQIKREQITERIALSVQIFGNQPNKLASIIGIAITVLEIRITDILSKAKAFVDKVLHHKPKVDTESIAQTEADTEREQSEAKKQPAIPLKPQMSKRAASYHRLCEIEEKLKKQNQAIFEAERKRGNLEIELSECKGIFKIKRRSELEKEIAVLDKKISNMKTNLRQIVKEYGFQNVEAFYKALYGAKADYSDYVAECKVCEEKYVEKPKSIRDRLKEKEPEVKERQSERQYRQSKDRGAR